MYSRLLATLVAISMLAHGPVVHGSPPSQASSATLTVLAGDVRVQTPGGAAFDPASDGQTVAVGARVRTGPGGRALLTFFDGSTATLDPETEISLDRVEPTGNQGALLMGVGLTVGRIWAQVTSLVERGSSVEVQAGSATALGRAGVTGFRVFPDGSAVCWDIDGAPMRVRTPSGEFELAARQQIAFPPAQTTGAPAPRQFEQGLLEVQTAGPILARLVDPRGLTVGFPLNDLVVNQVLDSSTSLPNVQPRSIHVPGPAPGVHRLVMESDGSGPYTVRVSLSLDATPLFEREWTGAASPGERLVADLAIDAANGAPAAARLDEPRPLSGEPPGRFIYP